MHLLATSATSLDETVEPVDLDQTPGDVAVLSFADTDLAGLAAAWASEREALPSVRLASLRDLRHPMSVDIWIDRVASHAKVILVRLLGGVDWWRYGIERLATVAREHGIALAVLPGEDRDDPRLSEISTLPADELKILLRFFREGGHANLRALLRRLASIAGAPRETPEPRPLPRLAGYVPGVGSVTFETLAAQLPPGHPVIPIIFYRALLLASDTSAIDALCQALTERGLASAPLVITSLKEPEAAEFVRTALVRLAPAVVVTTTAFAAAGAPGEATPLDLPNTPVLQVVLASTRRAAWRESARGLGAADLAMHVVLPELDGRVLTGAIAFKEALAQDETLGFSALVNQPEPDRVAFVADRIAALVRLQRTPRHERRIAILLPDYSAPGRAGYAVGLDVPASVLALVNDLSSAGYAVGEWPQTSRDLIDVLEVASAEAAMPLATYIRFFAQLPENVTRVMNETWGAPTEDPELRDGAFQFRVRGFGNVLVGFPPDRGRAHDRHSNYHNPTLPPSHALLAFGLWLQHVMKIEALVHMGAHGTLEWLPGKTVALTSSCFPEIVLGPLPVIYPFIVSNPGEAAHAKRRIGAVTIGHLPPPLISSALSGEAHELERLVDEYAQADGLDRKRRERLARLIVETAQRNGLAREARVEPDVGPDEALVRIDAWLCDLKDLAHKDGLHIYGRTPASDDIDPAWRMSATAERCALIAALDGQHIAPGPAGAPSRGRRNVLPTGRNLFTADPRMLPTPTATEFGRLAAEEVIRTHLQTHGEIPRALVIDLWGSATLRSGGEEIALGLALLGCRPTWDHSTGRVTGVEVLPIAALGRSRVDVTWRISGLFRDLFPAQIALLDAAAKAVATRDEGDDDNPLAALRRSAKGNDPAALARIFGTAPGAYGAGIEGLLGSDADLASIGAAYVSATSHVYGGAEGTAMFFPGAFAARVADADALVHPSDDPGRDLLEGAEDAAFVGGFAAAASSNGSEPDLIMLDITDPQRPRARPLDAALARIVRGRAVNPRFIAGLMRHGPRGAAELAETVDRLVDFAQTTGAVSSTLFDLIYEAYVRDECVREFLLRENPAAGQAIAARLEAARRSGLWHPRRNDLATDVLTSAVEAAP